MPCMSNKPRQLLANTLNGGFHCPDCLAAADFGCVLVSRPGCSLLVIVCDNKVLLYDIATRRSFEVTRTHLEGKSPTCVAYLLWGGPHAPGGRPEPGQLMTSPVLAIGCSDGHVRLVHLATLRVRSKGVVHFRHVGYGLGCGCELAPGRRLDGRKCVGLC